MAPDPPSPMEATSSPGGMAAWPDPATTRRPPPPLLPWREAAPGDGDGDDLFLRCSTSTVEGEMAPAAAAAWWHAAVGRAAAGSWWRQPQQHGGGSGGGADFFYFWSIFLPSVKSGHDKAFAVCPTSCTRQRSSLPTPIRRVPFVVCNTRQRLCHVFWHTANILVPVVN